MSGNPPTSEEDLKSALVEMATALAQFNTTPAVIGGMATQRHLQRPPPKQAVSLSAFGPVR